MIRLLLLAAALLAGACNSVDAEHGPLTGTASHVGDDEIEDVLELENGRVAFTYTDLAVYQIDLVSDSDEDVHAEVRGSWYDDAGMRVPDVTQHWKPVVVPPGTRYPLRLVAPSFNAVRCEVEVRIARSLKG